MSQLNLRSNITGNDVKYFAPVGIEQLKLIWSTVEKS